MGKPQSIKKLWSESPPERPVLIMGNSDSVNMFPDELYQKFTTIGCNSRIHQRYIPDLTLMVDANLPMPDKDATILTQIAKWKDAHPGPIYQFRLGRRMQFQPDRSTDKVDYSITTVYMAMIIAHMMGSNSIHFVGIDLQAVNGKDYHDEKKNKPKPLSETRSRFFGKCFNHLSFLINKMARYYKVQFFSLSPHSLLLTNGNVKPFKKKEVPHVISKR